MKTFLNIAGASLIALTLSCCKKSNDTPSNTASLMVVNGTVGVAGIDATVGGAVMGNGNNLTYGRNTGYQNVASGSQTIAMSIDGLTTSFASSTESMAVGSHYSAFAGGFVSSPFVVFTTDDVTPVSGEAKVRFVNLSPDGFSAKCYVNYALIDSNVNVTDVTSFAQVPPSSSANIGVTYTGSTSPLQLDPVTLVGGKVYTVVISGSSSGGSSYPLTMSLINNN